MYCCSIPCIFYSLHYRILEERSLSITWMDSLFIFIMDLRNQLTISRRVYALAQKLADPIQLPSYCSLAQMTDTEMDTYVHEVQSHLQLQKLKNARLHAQLSEANNSMVCLAKRLQEIEEGQELKADSEWMHVETKM